MLSNWKTTLLIIDSKETPQSSKTSPSGTRVKTVWDLIKKKLMAGMPTKSEQPTERTYEEDGVAIQSEEKR